MANLKFNPQHNICAYLDSSTTNAQKYAGIIEFLQRSRIFYSITVRHDAYRSHQILFWNSAVYEKENDPSVIKGKILDQNVTISEADIRRMLQFGDSPKDPILLNKFLVRGCFLRMKYTGDITEGNLKKKFLCPQLKYLMHVMVHCLGPRKGGFDSIREVLQSAMVALVLNKPYNFSGMLFHFLTENLKMDKKSIKNKFLMFPRFLQMIFDDKLLGLPKANADRVVFDHMSDVTFTRLNVYRGVIPADRRLFGHLASEDYVAPAGRAWRHDESDSDIENIVVPDDDSDDDDVISVDDEKVVRAGADVRDDVGAGAEVIRDEGDVGGSQTVIPTPPHSPIIESAPLIESTDDSNSTERYYDTERLKKDTKLAMKSSFESSRGETSRQADMDRDLDYVRESSHSPSPSHMRTQPDPSSSLLKGKAKVVETKKSGRKRKFELIRRTPMIIEVPVTTTAATTVATSVAATTTTSMQTTIPLSQTLSSLREVFAGRSMLTVDSTVVSATASAGIPTPFTVTFSPIPGCTAGASSSSLTLQEQIDDLKRVVEILTACRQNDQAKINILQLKVTHLEKENSELKQRVDRLEENDQDGEQRMKPVADDDDHGYEIEERRTKKRDDTNNNV